MTTTTTSTRAAVESGALDRAVTLARRGPVAGGNPRVGCVILGAGGAVLAEGHHGGAGTPHAEADALSRVPPGRVHELTGATAVVTLEPCHHTGRTPPCSRALHAAGLGRVVHAVADPDPRAAGGAAWLKERGVDVATSRSAGLDAAATARAEDLVHDWAAAVRRGRPWLIAKAATSLDGRVAATDGTSRWITSEQSRAHAHAVRAEVDAILVGTGTLLADDPQLSARTATGHAARQPLRVVVGRRPVPPGARLRSAPGRWLHLPTRDLSAALGELHRQGARRVLLDGGPTLLTAALRADVVDELHWYAAPVLLGRGAHAVGDLDIRTVADAPRWRTVRTHRLGDDLFLAARPQPKGDS